MRLQHQRVEAHEHYGWVSLNEKCPGSGWQQSTYVTVIRKRFFLLLNLTSRWRCSKYHKYRNFPDDVLTAPASQRAHKNRCTGLWFVFVSCEKLFFRILRPLKRLAVFFFLLHFLSTKCFYALSAILCCTRVVKCCNVFECSELTRWLIVWRQLMAHGKLENCWVDTSLEVAHVMMTQFGSSTDPSRRR